MALNISGYDLNTILYVFDAFNLEYNRLPRYNESYLGIPIGKIYKKLYYIVKFGSELDNKYVYKKFHLSKEEYESITDRAIGNRKKILTWEENFDYFKKFYYENGTYPRIYETYDDVRIGNWVVTQRLIYNNGELQEDGSYIYKSNRLTKEHIDMLNEFGFAWSNFDMYLNLLKEYIEEFKEYPKYNTIYKNENLGSWVERVRLTYKLGELQEDGSYMYNNNRLTKKEIDKLNNINFIWMPKKKEPVFNKNFEILKEYYELNLDCERYKGLNINTWSSQLRTTFNRGEEISEGVYKYNHNSELSFIDAIRLDEIDFNFITTNKYYTEIIKNESDMNKKKRYLLLKLERLLKEKKNFNSKDDVHDTNNKYMELVYKK